jgi:hypothetical protein
MQLKPIIDTSGPYDCALISIVYELIITEQLLETERVGNYGRRMNNPRSKPKTVSSKARNMKYETVAAEQRGISCAHDINDCTAC